MTEGPISGSAFGSWVSGDLRDQIELRQTVHAQKLGGWDTGDNARIYQAEYENAPWVCLRSSVNVPGQGSEVSRNYVLCGGTLTYDGDRLKFIQGGKAGAVGYGLDDIYGYRPKPGITKVTVKTKDTFGCIMEADIDFTVFSLKDLEAIDQVYFKPGMSALLEWGHSVWVTKENGKVQVKTMSQSKLYKMQDFLNQDPFKTVDKNVQDNRISNSFAGNYEAIFGYITNFSWSFNNEGNYSCKVKILSKGSILEGLQVPAGAVDYLILSPNKVDYSKVRYADPRTGAYIGGSTDQWFQYREDYKREVTIENDRKLDEDARKTPYHYLLKTILAQVKVPELRSGNLEGIQWKDGTPADYGYWGQMYIRETSGDQENPPEQPIAFISLDTFLQITNQILKISRTDFPRFETRLDDDYKEQGFATFKEHFSLDPYKALVPFRPTTDLKTGAGEDGYIAADPSIDPDNYKDYTLPLYLSKIVAFSQVPKLDNNNCIADIKVGVNYILNCIDSVLEGNSESYRIRDIVDRVLSGVQKALGNVNAFGIHIDHVKNTASIVDRNCICHDPADKQDDFELTVSGKSSVLTSFIVGSEISAEVSNEMSVAATTPIDSLNGVKGNSSIVIWNEGCVDRHKQYDHDEIWDRISSPHYLQGESQTSAMYKPDKPMVLLSPAESKDKQIFLNARAFLDKAANLYTNFFRKTTETAGDYKEGAFEILQTDGEDLFQKCINRDIATKTDTNPSTSNYNGLVPIKVTFSTRGLGRFIIGTTFKISKGQVPAKYLRWRHLITGIEHSIDSKGWFTTVNTLAYPAITKEGGGSLDNVRPNPCEFPDPSEVYRQAGDELDNTYEYSGEYKPLPPPTEAVESFVRAFWRYTPSTSGNCAGYVAMLAKSWKSGEIEKTGGWGDAGDVNQYGTSIVAAHAVASGWTVIDKRLDVGYEEVKKAVRGATQDGDIAIYYWKNPNPEKKGNITKYYWKDSDGKPGGGRHAQMKVPNISVALGKPGTVKGKACAVGSTQTITSGWTTSDLNNYGTSTVYDTAAKSHTPDQWDVWILRAPTINTTWGKE